MSAEVRRVPGSLRCVKSRKEKEKKKRRRSERGQMLQLLWTEERKHIIYYWRENWQQLKTPRLCQHTHIKWARLYICVCALCCVAAVFERGFEMMSGPLNIKQHLTRERNYSAELKGYVHPEIKMLKFRSALCWRKVWRKFCSPGKQSCCILLHSWGRWEQKKTPEKNIKMAPHSSSGVIQAPEIPV